MIALHMVSKEDALERLTKTNSYDGLVIDIALFAGLLVDELNLAGKFEGLIKMIIGRYREGPLPVLTIDGVRCREVTVSISDVTT